MLDNFHQRLEYALSHSSWEGDSREVLEISSIYTAIQKFESDYSSLLLNPIWEDTVLELQRQEFSLLLTLYRQYFDEQSSVLLKNDLIHDS